MASTDKKTLELIQLLRKQKAEIARIERPSWRTNRTFAYVEGSSSVTNLAVESNVKNLVAIASFLLERSQRYKEASALIGAENTPEFTWGGYPLADWLEDLKLRVAKIQIESKRKRLELLESKLNAIVSPEMRASLELDAIEAELKG